MAEQCEDKEPFFSKPSIVTTFCDDSKHMRLMFGELLSSEKFSDFNVICRGRKFCLHKIVLAAGSKYFHDKFLNSSTELAALDVDYDPMSFEYCLKYMYTGEVAVPKDSLESISQVAEGLGIASLHKNCLKSFYKDVTITPPNALKFLCLGFKLNDRDLLMRARSVALSSFSDLQYQQKFLQLEWEYLSGYLSNEKLSVQSDDERLGAAIRWVKHDQGTRLQHLPTLVQALPIHRMSVWFLKQTLHDEVIQACPSSKKLIGNTLDYLQKTDLKSSPRTLHATKAKRETVKLFEGRKNSGLRLNNETKALPDAKDDFSSHKNEPPLSRLVVGNQRKHHETKELKFPPKFEIPKANPLLYPKNPCLMVVGARYCVNKKWEDRPNDVLWMPLTLDSEPQKLTSLPSTTGNTNFVACCANAFSLHVSGYGPRRNYVASLHIGSGIWEKCGHLNVGRTGHCMALVTCHMFVLGGCKSSTDTTFCSDVEKWNPRGSTWTVVGKLNGQFCYNTCCATIGDDIIVYGAMDKDHRLLVQVFSTASNTVTHVMPLLSFWCGVYFIFIAADHVIMADQGNTCVCSIRDLYTDSTYKEVPSYKVPNSYPTAFLDARGAKIKLVGGDSPHKEAHFVYEASVRDLIGNRGKGWSHYPWDACHLGKCEVAPSGYVVASQPTQTSP